MTKNFYNDDFLNLINMPNVPYDINDIKKKLLTMSKKLHDDNIQAIDNVHLIKITKKKIYYMSAELFEFIRSNDRHDIISTYLSNYSSKVNNIYYITELVFNKILAAIHRNFIINKDYKPNTYYYDYYQLPEYVVCNVDDNETII